LVNQKIKEGLVVQKEKKKLKEALQEGALAFFKEKYPPEVFVYKIGDFSKEICAGPHVENTLELGHFKIIKEEAVGANVRRIRAILE
jgi:alanyl-tRNA synthetase